MFFGNGGERKTVVRKLIKFVKLKIVCVFSEVILCYVSHHTFTNKILDLSNNAQMNKQKIVSIQAQFRIKILWFVLNVIYIIS